jgi:acyl-CoA synthetase (AMP-forming)/AMP-acid ligase II
MISSVWPDALKNLLRKNGSPVIERINESDSIVELLSAANIWTLALERKKILRKLGLKPGDILCEASDSDELIVNLVACAIGGLIYWPIKKSEVNKFIPSNEITESTSPNLFLINKKITSKVTRLELNFNFITSETVLLLSTSGTTGPGRIVGHTGSSLLYQIESINKGLRCQQESGRLIVLPLHHCFGLILDFLAGLFAKQQLHIRNTGFFSPEKILKVLSENDITHLSLVPRMVDLLLLYSDKRPDAAKLLKKIQIHVGGAVITDSLKNKASNIFGEFIEGYGLTECAGGVLLNGRPNGCEILLKPFDNTKSDIFELWIKSLSLGQFNNKEEWCDSDGFFQTLDLAEVKKDGTYRVLGRSGSLIKTTQGIWTHICDIEETIKKKFSITFFHLENVEGRLNIFISQNDLNVDLLNYFEKNYGRDCNITHLHSTEILEKILLNSQKKSTTEAINEWYRGISA